VAEEISKYKLDLMGVQEVRWDRGSTEPAGVKVGREHIFKPTIGNESLHEISNDNGIRVVNFACQIQKSDCQKLSAPTL
jgi:hypothetical protein